MNPCPPNNYSLWTNRVLNDQLAEAQKAIVLIDDIYGTNQITLKMWDRRNLKVIEKTFKNMGIQFERILKCTFIIKNYKEDVYYIITEFERYFNMLEPA